MRRGTDSKHETHELAGSGVSDGAHVWPAINVKETVVLDPSLVRPYFPALSKIHNGRPVVYFDNPGGTQCPRAVIDAVSNYLLHDNANRGCAFGTSVRTEAMLAEARQAMADLLGASSASEIVFGANMTSLTFAISRAIARTLSPGDEIVVTRLEHDANVSPWLLMAEDTGAVVRWADIREDDCTLDMDALGAQLTGRTKLVAATCASNAVGTITDAKAIVEMAHAAGALAYLDAVQYVPHRLVDVRALDCDFLVCSAYKLFGPHAVGILYGKSELLNRLPAYKVRPAHNEPPSKFETGTQNHEGIAGTLAAIEYLGHVADLCGQPLRGPRRERIAAGFAEIDAYERMLSAYLLGGLQQIKGVRIHGVTDPGRLHERIPTVSFTLDGRVPREVAQQLAQRGIFAWHGNYYAVAIMEKLDLQSEGMVRVGLVHYNTTKEVDDLLTELERM